MAHVHITFEEREMIALLLAEGKSKTEIARLLRRSLSSICREVERNSINGNYRPLGAQAKAKSRERGRPKCKVEDPFILRTVKSCLRHGWSPRQTAGRIPLDHQELFISHQTIYNWVNREACNGANWKRYLRRKGKRYRYSKMQCNTVIEGKRPLSERETDANDRLRYGDWEADTIEGAKGGPAVISMIERKSRYCILLPVKDRSSKALYEVVRERFRYNRTLPRETLTVDNGSEFACHKDLEKTLRMKVYFTRPHHPEDKGAVENMNGLVREYLPKGFTRTSPQRVAYIENKLNSRPRECLGFRTPAEVLLGQ